jgi:hypothetical protein
LAWDLDQATECTRVVVQDPRLQETRAGGIPCFFQHPPPFIPITKLEAIISHDNVRRFIESILCPDVSRDSRNLIVRHCVPDEDAAKGQQPQHALKARKILGAILLAVPEADLALRYLERIYQHHLNDSNLPFTADHNVMSEWEKRHQVAFWRCQWQFLAPTFDVPFTGMQWIDSWRPLPICSWTDQTIGPEWVNAPYQRPMIAKAEIHPDHVSGAFQDASFLAFSLQPSSVLCF